MRVHAAVDLYTCNVGLSPPPRSVRKRLLELGLWLPSCSRPPGPLMNETETDSSLFTSPPTDAPPAQTDPVSNDAPRPSKCKHLSIATWNVRSLGNKYSSVAETITNRRLDLLAVVESWHRDSRDVSVRRAAPAGFRFIDVPRDQGRGDGVVIYFRDFFIAKPLDINFKASAFEYVCVSITTPCGPVTVVAIYRP